MADILIIDDDAEILRVLRKVLEAEGRTITEASDVYMPEMDGIEFLIRLKEAFPETLVIAMSGGGHLSKDRVLGAASMLGAEGILEKPFTVEEVVKVVEQALVG